MSSLRKNAAQSADAAAEAERVRRLDEQRSEASAMAEATKAERLMHQKLADAQVDGEKSLRTTADRGAREVEEHNNQLERTLALADLRRAADAEQHESRAKALNDRADNEAEERHARKASVNLAITLAEEERFRRIAEQEREKLAVESEEVAERNANQRAASAAVEEERRRRLLNNPLGSPFARPGHAGELTDEQLEEEQRRAAILLADSAAASEQSARVHETAEEHRLASKEEAVERRLNQQHVRLLTETERARRMEEDEAAKLEEDRERRANISKARSLAEREQNDRISAAQHSSVENEEAEAQERLSNRLRALEMSEQERQAQIATPKKL